MNDPESFRTPEITIRPYEANDFEQICRLDAICFSPTIAYQPREIAWFICQPGILCYVALANSSDRNDPSSLATDRVVAWILANDGRRKRGHIITIDVHPSWRRMNLGTTLMERVECELARRGCNVVRLEVAASNSGAINFYSGRGYNRIRTLQRYYADESDAFLMEKLI